MIASLFLVVAVLQGETMVSVELPSGEEQRSWTLGERFASVVVAPDGTFWLPSATREATLVLEPGKKASTIPGRLVPLFFREPDRLYALFPGELVGLSYPERARTSSWPLPPRLTPIAAKVSYDGRIVAILSRTPEPQVLLVFPFHQGENKAIPLAQFPEPQALALTEAFVAVGGRGRVGVWPVGGPGHVLVEVPGKVVSMGWASESPELFVLVATPASQVLRVSVPKKLSKAAETKVVWRGQGEPRSLAYTEAGVVVLENDAVRLLNPRGRELGWAKVEGAQDLAIVPSKPMSGSVPWSDTRP